MSDKKFKVQSPLGYEVECSLATWENHIVKGHPMMEKNEKAVQETIKNPDVVYDSNKHPKKRSVYYCRTDTATYGKSLWTTVVIDNPDKYNVTGNVVSAWPNRKISDSNKEGGELYVKD